MSNKAVLGIDIGYDQLKLALVDRGQVVKTALAQMPENLLRDGEFTSLETMASLIRETMKENGIRASKAAVVLPSEAVYVKNVSMPMMTEEQLYYNLPFEFNDYISGEVDDYIFDYAVVRDDDSSENEFDEGQSSFVDEESGEGEEPTEALHLMAVGVERRIVENYQTMLRKAGLKMVKSAPPLCAYISLLRQKAESLMQVTNEFGILDLGYHTITMYMYKKDRYIATRDFEIGLSSLDDIVAEIYGVEKHLAHTYVLSNFEDCLEKEECLAFYDNIAVELMRAINFYEFSNQGSSLDDLWVCGGGAVSVPLIRSIYETLEARLHRSDELLTDGDTIPQYNIFVQAIGVALEI